ncbi:hypothetical protein [Sandaracinus amylolyticus]|uniref:hypothetical protein n=1 Tax=Sandaracinus amylolyticus TaxID=927083 RepID=UPI001F2C4BBE|nr:hypothetical protein [Sandaracinus amylolyticus]UJR83818.1 Hypothetical protein I5071_58890 [Sandaracinus amylolyticus]
MTRTFFLWIAMLASCSGSRGTSTPAQDAPETSAPTASSTSATTASDHGSTEAPVETGPAPVLAIRGTPARAGREVAIVIENRGTELARVSPRLVLERASSEGRFARVDATELALRPSCEREAPTCVELAPGAALHPPAWLGTTGDAQCACERCVPAEPGTYRFVATSCGGAHRLEGEPFEIVTR